MITYPGIEERMREQLQFFESLLDKQIEGLDSDTRATVSEACASCGLDGKATRYALVTVCDLIEFERHGRDRVLTDAERFEIIEYIRDTSYSLAMAMKDLPPRSDGIELHLAFRDMARELGEFERMKLNGSGAPDALTFSVLAAAADRMLTRKGDLQGKGGRRPLRAEYSRFIATLANEFERAGLPVGRGGAFERLCAVVFETAGVRATPEGAIRYYLTERKKQAQSEPENSSEDAAE